MVRDAVPLGECGRALVVKLRHHGDVLLAAPVLAALKAHAPALEVDALVYDDSADMLAGHPALAQLHTVGRRWKEDGPLSRLSRENELFRKLKSRSYDLIVHLSEQPRGAWLARTLGARYSVAPAMPERGAFWRGSFTHFYPIARRRHQVEVNLDALRRIGLQPRAEDKKVIFVPGVEAQKKAATLAGNDPFVHLHAASRWRFKCLTVEQNAALVDRLAEIGLRVVLTAAPDAAETLFIDEIVKRCRAKPLNVAGQLSIRELAALSARARLFVGVDSMPMHLACAMGTPVVALFGPSGEAEWGPWSVPHRVVTSAHSCRPCGLDGCGGGKVSECLTTLPVDAIFAAAREFL
ncbi:MAG TPA: putative lipopolysaccharide heptosyltransferase III [Burkholderiales bacterium]|nr:putative lipopolysaccharide heptosyltransferase III [Burkholderiales bacterium]